MSLKSVKNDLIQIFALAEKDLKLQLRFKIYFVLNLFTSMIIILIPLILMALLFKTNPGFGVWTAENFVVYQFIAYNIFLMNGLVTQYPNQLHLEKFWKTLPFLMIGSNNRYNILFGRYVSHVISISIPFTFFFILSYIFVRISLVTVFFVIVSFLLLALIFAGISMLFGVFAISNENLLGLTQFIYPIFMWFTCLMYPFEIYPPFIQDIINLNPLYHIFYLLRVMWIEDNMIVTITRHPFEFTYLIILAIVIPMIGVYLFNKIFKRYGIVGY
ncbi:MAG: ABC transporter permease [Promethearchaeota archaeon]